MDLIRVATMLDDRHPNRSLMTAADYLSLPDDGNRYELIHGELMMSPSASFGHGAVVAYVAGVMAEFVRNRRLGRVGVETDVILDEELVLRPDISFVSNRRRSIVRRHIHGAPDLVVEVASPGNWQIDVFAKRHEYERFGVREYWALDIVESRNKAYQWYRHAGRYRGGLVMEKVIKSRVLKGLKLKLEEVWEAAQP